MNSLTSEDRQAVFNMMTTLDKVLKAKGKYVAVTDTTLDTAKHAAMRHHYRFLKRCGIQQATVDPYKILSWYGFYLAANADDIEKVSVLGAMRVMNHMLDQEKTGKRLSEDIILHLYQLVKNDGVEDD